MAYNDYQTTGGWSQSGTDAQGGFMTDAQPSSSQPQKSGGGSSQQALRPVTIKMLLNATQEFPDAAYAVDGKELSQITLVGEIVSLTEQSTHMQMMLDDGTGVFEVKYWVDQEESAAMAQRRATWVVGKYVRVLGTMRAQKSMVAFMVRTVEDPNEVTYHMLEAIHVHLCHVKGGAQQKMVSSQPAGVYGAPASMPTAPTGMAPAAPLSGSLSDMIVSIFNNDVIPKHGLSIAEMAQKMNNQFPADKVRTAVEALAEEGQLYSTVDDDHYARS